MRHFIIILIATLFLWSCSEKASLQKKPNILLVTVDCQAWEDLPGVMPFLEMPALERLIGEGVVFRNHYSNAPLNQPSRYSIISSLYPHNHFLMSESGNWLPDNSPVLMESLSEQGYYTVGLGEMYFKPWERMAGFDRRITAEGLGESIADTVKNDDYKRFLKSFGYSRKDYLKFLEEKNLPTISIWPLNHNLSINAFIGEEARNFLFSDNALQSKPWFMWVSFNGPAYPWFPSEKNFQQYLAQEMPDIRTTPNELKEKPYDHTATRYGYMRRLIDYMEEYPQNSDSVIHAVKAAHYASLSDIDKQLGIILRALEENGYLENTLILYTAIKGALLGDHYNFNGGNVYERSAHVPFIVWMPLQFRKSQPETYSSHVDIFPTLFEMAGGIPPKNLQGQSLVTQFKGDKNGESHVFIEILNNYSIVTPNYKLGYYTPYREGELYDLVKDPDELINRFDYPGYKKVIDSLTGLLTVFYPDLPSILNNRTDDQQSVTSIELRHGEVLRGKQVPDLAGKSFKLMMDMELERDASGPLIIYDNDNIHGFSLYFEEGYLCFSIRKWGKDERFRVSTKIDGGRVKITLSMKANGAFQLSSPSLKNSFSFKSTWPIPETIGHSDYFPKTIYTGISGDSWTKSYGNLLQGARLEGVIGSGILSVGY